MGDFLRCVVGAFFGAKSVIFICVCARSKKFFSLYFYRPIFRTSKKGVYRALVHFSELAIYFFMRALKSTEKFFGVVE